MAKSPFFWISLGLLASCNGGIVHGPSGNGADPADYVSNGERIYFTGTSVAGAPINATGSGSMGGMHRQMRGGGCATCHGAEREGRRLWPQFWLEAPALTAEALTGNDGHEGEEADGHGEHAAYNAESLRRAIIDGVDPAGEPLNSTMPRWSMSASDLDDLVSHLLQTHSHE